jgi:hypothetical protein
MGSKNARTSRIAMVPSLYPVHNFHEDDSVPFQSRGCFDDEQLRLRCHGQDLQLSGRRPSHIRSAQTNIFEAADVSFFGVFKTKEKFWIEQVDDGTFGATKHTLIHQFHSVAMPENNREGLVPAGFCTKQTLHHTSLNSRRSE